MLLPCHGLNLQHFQSISLISAKMRLDITCDLSAWQNSHMKCLICTEDIHNTCPCPAEYIKMPCPFLYNQSDYLIQIIDINSYTELQTVQIQISWLLRSQLIWIYTVCKSWGISGFSRTRVKVDSVWGTLPGSNFLLPTV